MLGTDRLVGIVRIDGNCREAKTRPTEQSHNPTSRSVPCPRSSPMSLRCSPEPAARGLILHVDDDEGTAPLDRHVAALGRFRDARSELRRTGARPGGIVARPARRADRRLRPRARHDRHRGRRGIRQVVRPRGADGHAHRRPGQCRGAVARGSAGVGGAQAAAARTPCWPRCRRWSHSGAPSRPSRRISHRCARSVALRVQRQHARQILLDVLDAILRRRMRAQEFRRAPTLCAHWPSCSTA